MSDIPATDAPVAISSIPRPSSRARFFQVAKPYLLILPTLIFIAAFTIWPAGSAVIQSTIKPGPTVKIPAKFVGFGNYVDLFDPSREIGQAFPHILVQTLAFVVTTVPVSMVLALMLALLLNRQIRALGWYRLAFFYPVLMPMIGAASVFAFIFANQVGLANTILRSLGLSGIQWTGDPVWTPLAIDIVVIWKTTGFFMILYLAAIQNLPDDVFEAADLDGAGLWDKLSRVTIPLLSSTTLFIFTSGVANAFQTVDQLYALGEGQPNERSNLMLYYVFQKYNEPVNLGYVNAITVILLAMLLIFTLFNFFVLERRTYYES